MKKLGVAGILIALVAVFVVPSRGVDQPNENVQKLMRQKLTHSQGVLEGLCIEDYKMIVENAKELAAISKAASWNVIETPEYAVYSAEFNRTVKDLAEAAEKENLDGATLAYVGMTVKCVACHKYVRGVRLAAGEGLSPEFDLQTASNLLP